jgi:hypothetical protein
MTVEELDPLDCVTTVESREVVAQRFRGVQLGECSGVVDIVARTRLSVRRGHCRNGSLLERIN